VKKGYKGNIEHLAVANTNFREVLYTAKHCQLVLTSLLPGEEVGLEVHEHGDQFLRFEMGEGSVFVNKTEYVVGEGDAVIVPEGAIHNIINTSQETSLRFYSVYAPPEHLDKLIHATKEDSETHASEFDGTLSEY